jgi:hypothetical protein
LKDFQKKLPRPKKGESGATHNTIQRVFTTVFVKNFLPIKFSAYKNVRIVRGIVPDSFTEAVPEKIAFLHIDMNSVNAEILALEHLFDRVVPGGLIVFDDFGWTCNVNQMTAELAFMNERNHHVMELPTGQGMVIKHA